MVSSPREDFGTMMDCMRIFLSVSTKKSSKTNTPICVVLPYRDAMHSMYHSAPPCSAEGINMETCLAVGGNKLDG